MNLHVTHRPKITAVAAPDFTTELDHFDPRQTLHLKKHSTIIIRVILPEDEASMVKFHAGLSEESIYLRYFEHISLDTRTLHDRLARVCTNAKDSFAVVAEKPVTGQHAPEILAVGRLTTTETVGVTSFALLVSDEMQETELPYDLLKRLIMTARAFGFHTLNGELLVADHDALNLCRKFGFTLHTVPDEGIVKVSLPL